jgi:hypothetical protein
VDERPRLGIPPSGYAAIALILVAAGLSDAGLHWIGAGVLASGIFLTYRTARDLS